MSIQSILAARAERKNKKRIEENAGKNLVATTSGLKEIAAPVTQGYSGNITNTSPVVGSGTPAPVGSGGYKGKTSGGSSSSTSPSGNLTGKVEVFGSGGNKEETRYYIEGEETGRISKDKKGNEYASGTTKGVKQTFTFDTQGGTKKEVVELGGSTGGARITEYEMMIGGSGGGLSNDLIGGDFSGFDLGKTYGGTRQDLGFAMPSDVKQHYDSFGIMAPGTIYSYQTGMFKGTPSFTTKTIGEDWNSRPATKGEWDILNPLTVKAVGGVIGNINEKGEFTRLYSGQASSPLDWKGILGDNSKIKQWKSQSLGGGIIAIEDKMLEWGGKGGEFRKVSTGFISGIIPSTRGELLGTAVAFGIGAGFGAGSSALKIGGGTTAKVIGGGMTGIYAIGTGINMKMEPDFTKKGEILGKSVRDFGLFAGGYKFGYKTFVPRTEIIPLREGKLPTFKEEIYNVVANDKLYRVGKYEILVENQPPRSKITTNRFREFFDMKPLEVKYLPPVTAKVKTPFNVINEQPFTILEQKPLGKVGKVGIIEGSSKEFNVNLDIYGASNVEKYLVQGLYKYKTGLPAPSSNKELAGFFDRGKLRMISDIQMNKFFKMNIKGERTMENYGLFSMKGEKRIRVDLYPLGKRTTRFKALTEVNPIKETDVFSLYRSDTIFKDVTFPFARASGKTPAMKGTTLEWNEPIILEGAKDVQFIKTSGNKGTPFSDTFNNQVQKQIQNQKYTPAPKPYIPTPPSRVITQEMQPVKIPGVLSPKLSSQNSLDMDMESLSTNRFSNKAISNNAYAFSEISSNKYSNLGLEINKNISKNANKELNKSMNVNMEKNINKELTKEIQKNIQKNIQKTIQKNVSKNSLRSNYWGFTPRGTTKPPFFKLPQLKFPKSGGFVRGERLFIETPTFGTVLGKEFGISFDTSKIGGYSGLGERQYKTGIKLPTTLLMKTSTKEFNL